MSRPVIPEYEREMHRKAIDPGASAWVSANAGSGKTTILTKRVIRLMLSGVSPERILCLTYTRAASAEMQNRVFDTLGSWVTMNATKLAEELDELEGQRPDAAQVEKARRLFAHAVETPGGLRIQTIHAFCERLLHLFPFEANVPARFRLMDEAEQGAILSGCIAEIQRRALADHGDPFFAAFSRVAEEAGFEGFPAIVRDAISRRDALMSFAAARLAGDADCTGLRARLGLDPDDTEDGLDLETLTGGIPMSDWPEIAGIFDAGTVKDRRFALAMREAIGTTNAGEKASAWQRLFLLSGGDLKLEFGTRSIPGPVKVRLAMEALRIGSIVERRRSVRAVGRTEALFTVADEVAALYSEQKRIRAVLDFDDVISRTANLLDRTDSRWILFKLDAGIDHLLVDEAQDTSPDQWRILVKLTEEFFAGKGQASRGRTIFAVGDEKQSIFSFQGAVPEAFDSSRTLFGRRIDNGVDRFHEVTLQLSFRSTADVLSAVDEVFQGARYHGLGSEGAGKTIHDTTRVGKPGLVEIWTPDPVETAEDPDPHSDAVTKPGTASETTLAERIAARIALWLKNETRYDDDGQRLRAGDVMILVRRRNAFFEAMIRALKTANVPVAGADRITLASHIAVMDLIACAEAALLPQDDLTLATALKTPLLGLDDDDLIAIAADRGEDSVVDAFEREAALDPRRAEAFARFQGWRQLARCATPFQFFSTLLGEQGGRRRMLARLGPDAAEAMDVFLSDCILWQTENSPSLFGFLDFVRGADRTVKREFDSGSDAVRVMTVHAAKGLEARIVFLADTLAAPDHSHDPDLLTLADRPGDPGPTPTPVWSSSAKKDSAPIGDARTEARRLALEEYRRLLYVAMTRARDRLYIAGYLNKKEPKAHVWFKLIEEAVAGHANLRTDVKAEDGVGIVQQWWTVPRGNPARPVHAVARSALMPLPDWLLHPVPAAGTAARTPAQDRLRSTQAQRRGILVHALLERLPEVSTTRRAAVADRWLDLHARDLDRPARQALRDATLGILDAPVCATLFGGGSRAEVAIGGSLRLPSGRSISVASRIDRLAVLDDEIVVADYKTGVPPGSPEQIPDVYLRQIALYRALVMALYPGRPVRAGIVWTAIPALAFADAASLDAALLRIDADHEPPPTDSAAA